MFKNKNKNERGQSIIIIAIMFLGLVAVAALIIDGGSLYLNRRVAQTAADAAAMAGAREMCVKKGSLSAVQNIVNKYAITENGATAVESMSMDDENYTVVVRTRVETPSFFARGLGYENDTVRAEASAGCFTPATTDELLPIAWTCRPAVGGSTGDCTVHSIPIDIFKTLLTVFNFGPGTNENMLLTEGDGADYQTYTDAIGGKMTYLVMDSDSFTSSIDCMPPIGTGLINCDFNNDGILDVEGGANRG
ncbi:MAG: pilus assembly protein TadG-related protein [Anaerolineales bacterium]|nr:pilus assembly protein TadG-related protein [Anaerolineales bacterium]